MKKTAVEVVGCCKVWFDKYPPMSTEDQNEWDAYSRFRGRVSTKVDETNIKAGVCDPRHRSDKGP